MRTHVTSVPRRSALAALASESARETGIRLAQSRTALSAAVGAVCLLACADPADPRDPPCFDGLPDLNGDGAYNEADCDLIGVGPAVASVCANNELWRSVDACAAESASPLSPMRTNIGALAPDRILFRNFDGTGLRIARPPTLGTVSGWRTTDLDLTPLGPVAFAASGSVFASPSTAWIDRNADDHIAADELVDLRAGLGATAGAPWVVDGAVVVIVVGTRGWVDRDHDATIDADETFDVPGPLFGLDDNAMYVQASPNRITSYGFSPWPPVAAGSLDIGRCDEFLGTALGGIDCRFGNYIRSYRSPDPTRDIYPPGSLQLRQGVRGQYQVSTVRGLATWIDEDFNGVAEESEVFGVRAGEQAIEGAVAVRCAFDGECDVPAVLTRSPNGSDETVGAVRARATAFLGDPCDSTRPCAMDLACIHDDNLLGSFCIRPPSR